MPVTTDCLNEEQRAAALDTEGAVLVTAGAGSGKTRLLTHRIAHIIEDLGIPAYNVLAITFTNKAAEEMKNRLYSLIPNASDIWVSTFHAMCAKILRRHAAIIGYGSNFTIYSQDESERLIKQIAKDMRLDGDTIVKSAVRSISSAKNDGLSPEEYRDNNINYEDIEVITDIYIEYERRLKSNNAMDFDDLLLKTYYLFSRSSEVLDSYCRKFKYIHVDEFQDTNEIQYGLVRLLASKNGNIFVVGDEDQSIYGWRGANVTNMQKFIEDFGAKIYKLEQNYRSTKNILSLANNLIKNNTSRIDKKLWSALGDGDSPVIYKARSEAGEADFVVNTIRKMINDGYRPHDFAVLMRVNALTRTLEQRFMQYALPYKVYGGFKFFDRKEVKDVIAYLRVLSNHYDEEALTRIINFPKRGIGDSTVEKIREYCAASGKCFYDAIAEDIPVLSSSTASKVTAFGKLLHDLDEYKLVSTVAELSEKVIELAGIKTAYLEDTEENTTRKLNIDDFVSSAHEFVKNRGGTLDDFLQEVTLYTEGDDEASDSVYLSTVHSAKGMEFRCVFIVGAEEGLFPLSRATEDTDELEEERRLMYVAITRAKEKLYLTYCESRFMYGRTNPCRPSRFFGEMDSRLSGLYAKPKTFRDDYANQNDDQYTESGFTKKQISGHSTGNAAVRQNAGNVTEYTEGTRVRHKKFGEGTVVGVTNVGKNSYLVINFDKFGKITLSLAFAPIEKI